jgi:hypothetical protein
LLWNYWAMSSLRYVIGELVEAALPLALSALKDVIDDIGIEFSDEAQGIVHEMLEGANVRTSQGAFGRAIVNHYTAAARAGWFDGGGEAPLPSRAIGGPSEVVARAQNLFDDLLELRDKIRAGELTMQEARESIADRLRLWAQGLRAHYNRWKLEAHGDKVTLFRWELGATEEHCDTCLSLASGAAHTASWYLRRNYIPGQPGADLECGGFNCDCMLVDVRADEDFTRERVDA